jgi:hypothetical protein
MAERGFRQLRQALTTVIMVRLLFLGLPASAWENHRTISPRNNPEKH